MKKQLIVGPIICFIVIGFSGFSQEIISTAGEHTESSGYQLSWTLGESIITSLTTNENILTQGFHQGKLTIIPVSSPLVQVQLKVYPNPTTKRIFIEQTSLQKLQFELYDSNSKMIKRNTLELRKNEINVETLPNGTYYLKVLDKKKLVHSYKVLKIY